MLKEAKQYRYLVRDEHYRVGDEHEVKAASPVDAACKFVAWWNNVVADHPAERTVVVTGPDAKTVEVVVTLESVPHYTGKVR